MNVLVIDIGGTNVKMLATGEKTQRKFPSGPGLTPDEFVAKLKTTADGLKYDVASVGFPGPVLHGRPMIEPFNLGAGWLGLDFATALQVPVKVINDAAMQAIGSYDGGRMLFLGLGTGLGAAVIWDGALEPLEIGRYHYRKRTLEDYLGARGLKRLGRKKWQRHVEIIVERMVKSLEPDYVVLGGGNVKKLTELPPLCRAGENANAFVGGFRMWEDESKGLMPVSPCPRVEPKRPAEQFAAPT
jgi:polyphosphate glucokinase